MPQSATGRAFDEVVTPSENHEELARLFDSHKLKKEDYLDAMIGILSSTQILVEETIELTALSNQNQLIETNYIDRMSQLEPEIKNLYYRADCIGSAPTECRDLSQQFQNVMAMAHQIVLPFSQKGLEIWTKNNRNYWVNQAIKGYQKDLQKLQYELEKIH